MPARLRAIVERALAKDPSERHASASALRDEIVDFVRGGGGFPLRSFEAGETVVSEGEVGEAASIIMSGRCDLYRGFGPDRRHVRTMGPGEAFGETALLTAGPRTATVVAREGSTLQVIEREAIERELDTMKPWMGSILRGLAERFREIDERDS